MYQPSGLYYYRARMYSPTWGRFLQPDPIGYAGGANLYAYVNNDPVNNTDPQGLCYPACTVAGGAVLGGAVGGGLYLYENWNTATIGGLLSSVGEGAVTGAAAGSGIGLIPTAIAAGAAHETGNFGRAYYGDNLGRYGNTPLETAKVAVGDFAVGAGSALIGLPLGQVVSKGVGNVLGSFAASQIANPNILPEGAALTVNAVVPATEIISKIFTEGTTGKLQSGAESLYSYGGGSLK
jgi:hypothetical protein